RENEKPRIARSGHLYCTFNSYFRQRNRKKTNANDCALQKIKEINEKMHWFSTKYNALKNNTLKTSQQ
ncbi:MAG: hypothetical protein ACN6PN_25465, partial [Sphingobacterium sp.]